MKTMVSWKQKIFEEESFIRRHRVLCFIFDRWCVMIYVSFIEFNLGYYVFGGFKDPFKQDFYNIAYFYMFYDPLGKIFTL